MISRGCAARTAHPAHEIRLDVAAGDRRTERRTRAERYAQEAEDEEYESESDEEDMVDGDFFRQVRCASLHRCGCGVLRCCCALARDATEVSTAVMRSRGSRGSSDGREGSRASSRGVLCDAGGCVDVDVDDVDFGGSLP